jgi:Ser/Thr protein kinase RdoA (MazF antagonist)
VQRLEPLLHAYNTTFALETADGRSFAVRVGTNSKSTVAHAVAQQSWIAAIAAETDVLVPTPLRTPDGRWCAAVPAPALERSLLVTVAAWLDGPDADELDVPAARALGRAMATLHAQAEGWRVPEGGALPVFDEPLFGDGDVLDAAPGLAASDRAVLGEARERAGEVFRRLHAGARLRPLHADLHGGNLKWHGGRLAVFDFDDAGLGLPVVDLAVSTFYLRGEDPALEGALRAGYAEVAPVPEVGEVDFEAVVAARQLLLGNAMLAMSTAELRAQAADYAQTTVRRLRRWLDTGRFTRAEA